MIEVDKKIFKTIIDWYGGYEIRTEVATIADRLNYFNKNDVLIGYIEVYDENKYYIDDYLYNICG